MLNNKYFFANIGVDAAEKEPSEVSYMVVSGGIQPRYNRPHLEGSFLGCINEIVKTFRATCQM